MSDAYDVYQVDPEDAKKNKLMAILAYLGPAVLAPILGARDSRFAQYHANQGLLLIIAICVLQLAIWLVGKVFGVIPFVGSIMQTVMSIIGYAAYVGWAVYAVLGILNANNGVAKELPCFKTMRIIKY